MDPLVQILINSSEPAVRYRAHTALLGQDPSSAEMQALREEIRTCPRVGSLLAGRDPGHPYKKWKGAHWLLASLADLAYPPGDADLLALFKPEYQWLLHKVRLRVQGRVRNCASMEGNALYAACALGLADERSAQLAEILLESAWPDSGWNCDKHPSADTSSFMETLIPLRGLAWYAQASGDPHSRAAVERAAEVFLSRHLYKSRHSGAVILPEFISLHYPCYWHYDILFGLKVMAEAGLLGDPRCADALDLLESKRLPGGGWAAEKVFYRVTDRPVTGSSAVSWGPAGKTRLNEWVTLDAQVVLKQAGRA